MRLCNQECSDGDAGILKIKCEHPLHCQDYIIEYFSHKSHVVDVTTAGVDVIVHEERLLGTKVSKIFLLLLPSISSQVDPQANQHGAEQYRNYCKTHRFTLLPHLPACVSVVISMVSTCIALKLYSTVHT